MNGSSDGGDGGVLFAGTHQALTFAFRYSSQVSPKSPMASLLARAVGGGRKGSGLGGVDGAAQAGMILGALEHLSAEQRHVLIARYGDVTHDCPACGQPTASNEWRIAVDALSLCPELADLPRDVRRAAVEKVVCRRKHIRLEMWSSPYSLSPRTVRSRVAQARKRFSKAENDALAWLGDYFEGRGLLTQG